jgi:hypothetical protein
MAKSAANNATSATTLPDFKTDASNTTTYDHIGIGMLAAGGALFAGGIVWDIATGGNSTTQEHAAVTPLHGGAAFTLSGSF